jgi:hypothetical protein
MDLSDTWRAGVAGRGERVCVKTPVLTAPSKIHCKPLVLHRSKSSRHERAAAAKIGGPTRRAMKILVPTLRFVARASRRAASTVVSTFFSAATNSS